MTALSLINLVKRFSTLKHDTIKNLSLTIEAGEFVVFVGPSGCGKSTLLRMIAGLEEPSSGEIYLGEKAITTVRPALRNIAMVFQSYALYPHMNVRANMAFALKLAKLPPATIAERVNAAAKLLDLEAYLETKPKHLSGGQRQRVAIGRAIVRDPQLFLFDEPLSNLDATLRLQTRLEISLLHKRLKTTMIYVTHDQVEAMTLADRIAVLNNGELAQFGTTSEVYHFPHNTFVARFIGVPRMSLLSGKVQQLTATSLALVLKNNETLTIAKDFSQVKAKINLDDTLTLGIRPEHTRLTHETTAASPTIKIVNKLVEHLGSDSYLYGDCSDESFTVRLATSSTHLAQAATVEKSPPPQNSSANSPPLVGQTSMIALAPEHIHLFDAAGRNIFLKESTS